MENKYKDRNYLLNNKIIQHFRKNKKYNVLLPRYKSLVFIIGGQHVAFYGLELNLCMSHEPNLTFFPIALVQI